MVRSLRGRCTTSNQQQAAHSQTAHTASTVTWMAPKGPKKDLTCIPACQPSLTLHHFLNNALQKLISCLRDLSKHNLLPTGPSSMCIACWEWWHLSHSLLSVGANLDLSAVQRRCELRPDKFRVYLKFGEDKDQQQTQVQAAASPTSRCLSIPVQRLFRVLKRCS